MEQILRKVLPDKYRSAFLAILILISFRGYSQTYNPSQHSVVSSAMGESQAAPLDARSMYWDNTNQVYRAYQNTSECLSYLNLAKYRYGNFLIIIDSGGTLQPNGTYVGGKNLFYMFKDSTANANLIELNLLGGSGVTSFGPSGNVRTGAIVPATGDYTFAQIGSPPTTIAGYGITDAVSLSGTQTLTNKTISGLSNTITNIQNSSLINNSIGLSLGTSGTDVNVGVTPAQLGSSLLLNIPNGGPGSRGVISAANYNYFTSKIDSVHYSGDSIYDCTGGACTFRGFVTGTGGIGSLNGLTATSQLFTTGTTGSDFNIVSSGTTHTFNLPAASASTNGKLLSSDWTTFNSKQPQLNGTGYVLMSGTSVSYVNATFLQNITGLVTAGTGISVTGSGTSGSPYLITSTGSGSGTVTSVAQAVPTSLLTISGSPITTNGTLAIGLSAAAAYNIWGNNTNATATPAYFEPTSTILNTWFGGAIQGQLTLTTTGTSGAATLTGTTLNIPNYATGGGSQNLTYTQNATNNNIAISGGNNQNFLTATELLAGLLDTSRAKTIDSLHNRTYIWPTYTIGAVQLLSPIGSTNDSFALGGINGMAFQNDSLYFANNKWFWYNLNASESSLIAGDSVVIHGSNGLVKYAPTSVFTGFVNPMTSVGDLILGGTAGAATRLGIGANTYVLTSNGTTASWQPASGGGSSPPFPDNSALIENNSDHTKTFLLTLANQTTSTLISDSVPTSNTMLAGVSVSNTFGPNQNFAGNILPTSGTQSIGSPANAWVNFYGQQFRSPANLIMRAGAGDSIQFQINGVNKAYLLPTGQWYDNAYIGNTFPGAYSDTVFTDSAGLVRGFPVSAISGYIVNIDNLGGKGDGKRLYGAVVVSGNTSVSIPTGNFTSADVGKAIVLWNAGTSAHYFNTTIASVTNSTTIVLAAAPSTSVSSDTIVYGTDNTAAIQAGLNLLDLHGGGKLWIGKGVHCVAGALQTSVDGVNPNAQITIPIATFSDSSFNKRKHFIIEGEIPPHFTPDGFADSVTSLQGTIIYCMITGSGQNPAVFGTKSPDATNANVNYNICTFENLTVLTGQDINNGGTTMGGINMYYLSASPMKNVMVAVDGSIYRSVQPSNQVAGIIAGRKGGEIESALDNVMAFNYYIGIGTGDATESYNTYAMNCKFGYAIFANEETVHFNFAHAYWNNVNVYFPNTTVLGYIAPGVSHFDFDILSGEVWHASGHWYDYTYIVSDTGNYGVGDIHYDLIQAAGTWANSLYNKYNGTGVEACAIGTNCIGGSSVGLPATLTANNTSTSGQQLIMAGYNTNAPQIYAGTTLNLQNYASDYGWLNDNVLFNNIGGVYTYINTGPAEQLTMNGGAMLLHVFKSGLSNGNATSALRTPIVTDTTETVAIGGNITPSTYAGATLIAGATSLTLSNSAIPTGSTSENVLLINTSTGVINQIASTAFGGAAVGGTNAILYDSSGALGGNVAKLGFGALAAGVMNIDVNQNAATGINIANTTSGALSQTYVRQGNGTSIFETLMYSPTTTAYGSFIAGSAGIYTTATALPIMIDGNASITFSTGLGSPAPQRMVIFGSGDVSINSTSDVALLNINGSLAHKIVPITATYSIGANDYIVTATSGTFTTTLPTAVGITGRTYIVKNYGTGTVTLGTTSSQTIDGATTQTLSTQYSGYQVTSDGSNWQVTGSFGGGATPTLQQVITAGATLTGTNTIALGTGNLTFSGTTGLVSFGPTVGAGLVISTHVQGAAPSSSPPSIAAGAGAGTSPTISLTGGDQSGVISVTTGTLPTASSTVVTVTYHTSFSNGTYPVLMPANATTALLTGVNSVYTTGTTTTFTITSLTGGLAASTAYSWYYYVGAD